VVYARWFINTCGDGRTNTVVRRTREAVRGHIPANRSDSCRASIFDGKALPDFVEAFFECVEASMKRAIVEIENIAERE
jgi:hypothetical protein